MKPLLGLTFISPWGVSTRPALHHPVCHRGQVPPRRSSCHHGNAAGAADQERWTLSPQGLSEKLIQNLELGSFCSI